MSALEREKIKVLELRLNKLTVNYAERIEALKANLFNLNAELYNEQCSSVLLEEENADLKDKVERLEGMKESFENSKRLYEKDAVNNPQAAWIYETCCDTLRRFEGGQG